MACPDLGSKCDASGNICYYNTTTCQFDCQSCSSGTYCQMQSGRAVCAGCTSQQQDNTLLINGKAGRITVPPGTLLTASVRNTSLGVQACPTTSTFGVVARSSPVTVAGDEIRVDSGTNIIDNTGCGTTSFYLNTEGTYILVGRICCIWNPVSNNVHCVESDGDTSNTVTVVISSAPVSTSGCDVTSCPPSKNLCVMGQCVPKSYVLIGAVAFFAMMIMKK